MPPDSGAEGMAFQAGQKDTPIARRIYGGLPTLNLKEAISSSPETGNKFQMYGNCASGAAALDASLDA
jgi:hypothetical protein